MLREVKRGESKIRIIIKRNSNSSNNGNMNTKKISSNNHRVHSIKTKFLPISKPTYKTINSSPLSLPNNHKPKITTTQAFNKDANKNNLKT